MCWKNFCKSNVMKKKVTNIFQHFFFKKNSLSRPFRALQTGENLQKKFGSSISKKIMYYTFLDFGTHSATQWHIKNNGHSGWKIETSKDVINIDIACYFDLMYWIPFSIIVFFACCKFFSTSVWTFRPLWYFDCFVFLAMQLLNSLLLDRK